MLKSNYCNFTRGVMAENRDGRSKVIGCGPMTPTDGRGTIFYFFVFSCAGAAAGPTAETSARQAGITRGLPDTRAAAWAGTFRRGAGRGRRFAWARVREPNLIRRGSTSPHPPLSANRSDGYGTDSPEPGTAFSP